jgi:hypothetical protein
VITLCAGLALLGLLAWAFSGGGGKPAAAKKAAQASGTLPSAARGAAANTANAPAGPASGVEPGGGCTPNAIVLSLFTSKASYHAGQYPVFEVDAVSTASRACTFNLSPARLHVLVSSSGRVIWDSADCTRGQPNKRAELRRGVPAQESLSWNRTISLPGCVTVASSAGPGTYQVQARDASVASPVRTFKLAR